MPQKKHIKKKFFFYLKENFVTLGGGETRGYYLNYVAKDITALYQRVSQLSSHLHICKLPKVNVYL